MRDNDQEKLLLRDQGECLRNALKLKDRENERLKMQLAAAEERWSALYKSEQAFRMRLEEAQKLLDDIFDPGR